MSFVCEAVMKNVNDNSAGRIFMQPSVINGVATFNFIST